jgi:carbamoyl-phosphate synthase large subunit
MKSTGESIGIDDNFGMAFYKSQLSAGMELPKEGKIFLSVKETDKKKIRAIAEKAANLGFKIVVINIVSVLFIYKGIIINNII